MIDRMWRTIATAICFACFGIGGLVIGVLLWPLLLLLVRDHRDRAAHARRVIRRSFAGFVRLMRALGVLTLEVHGAEELAGSGQLILPNHPSLIDVVILLALVENGSCIVKDALLRSPFTIGPLRAAGYIANSEGEGLLADCVEALALGDNLIVFPEGTRTVPGVAPRLLRGAGNIAVRSQCPVRPVVIRVSTPTLYKSAPLLHVPSTRPHFTVQIHAPLDMTLYRDPGKPYSVRARRFTESLQDYYSRETRGFAPA